MPNLRLFSLKNHFLHKSKVDRLSKKIFFPFMSFNCTVRFKVWPMPSGGFFGNPDAEFYFFWAGIYWFGVQILKLGWYFLGQAIQSYFNVQQRSEYPDQFKIKVLGRVGTSTGYQSFSRIDCLEMQMSRSLISQIMDAPSFQEFP